MHEQAVLVASHPLLGAAGTPVTIGIVEHHYFDSASANAAASFRCADQHCNVSVRCVIPAQSKSGRKTSPGAYFRGRHKAGCMRAPVAAVPVSAPAVATVPASPHRGSIPTVWIAPAMAGQAVAGSAPSSGGGSAANGSGRLGHGSGTSQTQSALIERFADEWLAMNAAVQRTTPLTAPWNPGGTYHSAVHSIGYHPTTDVTGVGERIFGGMLASVRKVKTGYVLTLVEKNPDGRDLTVWVQDVTFQQGRAGTALQARLAALVQTPTVGLRVFALGEFIPQVRPKHCWYALPIVHPHYLHLV